MTRCVFMGTPAFAVPALQALAGRYPMAGVVTQPDRPAGRGRQAAESPVKTWSSRAGLPVIQPERLSRPEALAQLREWAPDLIVVVAFGQILKPAVLDLPRHGCLNLHASLLPRHRGAAPIPAAILAGDTETGVSLMRLDTGVDTGPVLARRAAPILAEDTSGTLAERLADVGARLLLDTLPDYLDGRLRPEPQDESRASYAPQLKKDDGRLDFARPADELARRVRAFTPWPGAFALWNGQAIKVLEAEAVEAGGGPLAPGQVSNSPAGPVVACGQGTLLLRKVQVAGKRPTPGADFARGARGFIGGTLT